MNNDYSGVVIVMLFAIFAAVVVGTWDYEKPSQPTGEKAARQKVTSDWNSQVATTNGNAMDDNEAMVVTNTGGSK